MNVGDRNGETPLFKTIRRRLLENVRLLCGDFAIDSVNKNNQRPLHMAAELGYAEIVEFLLSRRASDIGIGDRQSNTPLHLAMCESTKNFSSAVGGAVRCDGPQCRRAVRLSNDHGRG